MKKAAKKKTALKDLPVKRATVKGGAEAYCVKDKKKNEIQNATMISFPK